jgi:hypothetical protein
MSHLTSLPIYQNEWKNGEMYRKKPAMAIFGINLNDDSESL